MTASQEKLSSQLFSYRKEWLRPDAIPGLTTAAVVIPKPRARSDSVNVALGCGWLG